MIVLFSLYGLPPVHPALSESDLLDELQHLDRDFNRTSPALSQQQQRRLVDLALQTAPRLPRERLGSLLCVGMGLLGIRN